MCAIFAISKTHFVHCASSLKHKAHVSRRGADVGIDMYDMALAVRPRHGPRPPRQNGTGVATTEGHGHKGITAENEAEPAKASAHS